MLCKHIHCCSIKTSISIMKFNDLCFFSSLPFFPPCLGRPKTHFAGWLMAWIYGEPFFRLLSSNFLVCVFAPSESDTLHFTEAAPSIRRGHIKWRINHFPLMSVINSMSIPLQMLLTCSPLRPFNSSCCVFLSPLLNDGTVCADVVCDVSPRKQKRFASFKIRRATKL